MIIEQKITTSDLTRQEIEWMFRELYDIYVDYEGLGHVCGAHKENLDRFFKGKVEVSAYAGKGNS